MAKPEWLGTAALSTAQVVTLTFGGTWEANDNVNISLFDEVGASTLLTMASGSTTIATICTAVAAAINAIFTAGNTASPFYKVLAAAGATTVTLTARTAGVPIYCSVTTTENGGGAADSQTLSASVTTPNSGPNDLWTAANYSTGAVPADGDTLYITAKASNGILYGLYQNTALTLTDSIELAALRIEQGHPQIGTLDAPLCYQYSTLDIGATPADGTRKTSSQICNLKPGDYPVAGTIRSTNSQGSLGRPPVQISVNNVDAEFTVMGTSIVGFGTAVSGEAGLTKTVAVQDKARVTQGTAFEITTLNPEGGTTNLCFTVTTINYGVGAVNVTGENDIGTATIGGKFVWESVGNIGTLAVEGKGEARLRAGDVTNASISGENSELLCDSGIPLSCVLTNGVDLLKGAIGSQVDFGTGVNVAASAI